MSKKGIYLLMAIAVITNSCKKNPLPAVKEDIPVFYAKFDMDGKPTNLEAGNEDYYMDALHYADTASKMFVFKGDLRKNTCANCAYALTVLFNDYKLSTPTSKINVDSALFTGQHYYNDIGIKTELYRVTFVPSHSLSGTYSWTFFDGKSTTKVDSFSVVKTIDAGKTYTVTLNYDDGAGTCNTSHLNIYKVGKALQANITATQHEPKFDINYSFSAQPKGQAPYAYLWDFDDQTSFSTDAAPTHSFAPKSGSYRVKLRVIDAKNDTCFTYYQISGSPENSCNANYVTDFTPLFNPKLFGSVTLLLTDPNGVIYSSKEYLHDFSYKFNLLSLKDYSLKNKAGEATKSVKFNFNCVVKNGSKEIKLSNGEAIMAVSFR